MLVTAGGTREPIDSVRFVGNSSSGRMGLALAEAARARGAEVTLVAANVALPSERRRSRAATSARRPSCSAPAKRSSRRCDVLLMAAAVADFRPVAPREGKIKKAGRSRPGAGARADRRRARGARRAAPRRPDARRLRRRARRAARSSSAREKLVAKGLDAIVVNDISRADIGFDVDANEVTILTVADGSGNGGDRGRVARPRRRSPRRSSTPSRSCAPSAAGRSGVQLGR